MIAPDAHSADTVSPDANSLRPFIEEVIRSDSPVQNTRRFAAAGATILGPRDSCRLKRSWPSWPRPIATRPPTRAPIDSMPSEPNAGRSPSGSAPTRARARRSRRPSPAWACRSFSNPESTSQRVRGRSIGRRATCAVPTSLSAPIRPAGARRRGRRDRAKPLRGPAPWARATTPT